MTAAAVGYAVGGPIGAAVGALACLAVCRGESLFLILFYTVGIFNIVIAYY